MQTNLEILCNIHIIIYFFVIPTIMFNVLQPSEKMQI